MCTIMLLRTLIVMLKNKIKIQKLCEQQQTLCDSYQSFVISEEAVSHAIQNHLTANI